MIQDQEHHRGHPDEQQRDALIAQISHAVLKQQQYQQYMTEAAKARGIDSPAYSESVAGVNDKIRQWSDHERTCRADLGHLYNDTPSLIRLMA